MKRIRPIAIILALASSVLLFSTGFATWYNLAPVEPPTPQSISMHSYEVIDLSDKIQTTGFNLDNFQYSSLAFVEGKNKMVVTYSIQYDGTVAFSLGYKNLSGYAANDYELFNNMLKGDNQVVISFDDGSTAITVNKDNKSTYVKANNDGDYLYFEKDFATASAATTLTVTYTFNIPTNSNAGNFRQNFGKYLKVIEGDKTVFVSTVANA